MKDTYYFPHDYNAAADEKIRDLIYKHGMAGYGIFWRLIEDLYQNTNVLRTNYQRIAFELQTDCETVRSVIQDFNLFVIEGDTFGSLAVQTRLEEREERSEKARNSVRKRWEKYDRNTNVIRPTDSRNTRKERKGKEKKGKEKDTSFAGSDKKSPTGSSSSRRLNIIFDLEEEKFKNITDKQITAWGEAYPALIVTEQLRQMEEWLKANPKNRKHNYERFINSWLKRSQDKAPRVADIQAQNSPYDWRKEAKKYGIVAANNQEFIKKLIELDKAEKRKNKPQKNN